VLADTADHLALALQAGIAVQRRVPDPAPA
jgi:hypothetical protein